MFKKTVISIAIICVTLFSFSQENFTIKTKLKMDGLPPEYAAYGEQDMITYIKGEKLKTELISMMMNQIIVFDGQKQTILTEVMGNKAGCVLSKAEMESIEKKDNEDAKIKIEYLTDKKTIANYECTKAIITSVDKDKKETKMIVWFTDKINNSLVKKYKVKSKNTPNFGDLKGYPLEMEISAEHDGMTVKVISTTTEIKTELLSDSVFEINTSGYSMMNYKDFMEKQKMMGK